MLLAPATLAPADVGDHYDRLDEFYRSIWGRTLHHGLWFPGESRSVEAATDRLLTLLLSSLSLRPGLRVVDIGCGYGVDAHRVAERTGAHVSGITIYHAQAEKARYITPPIQGKVSIEHGDWLQNTYPAQSFDRAIAVESLSHMQDKKRFFFEMHRVLVPGGRAAVACWTIEPEPSAAERALLQLICQAGSLPSLGSMRDYQDLSHAAGLSLFHSRDLTALVEPTWGLIARKTFRTLARPRLLASALKVSLRRPLIACAIPAMILAFRAGVLRYRAFWMEKVL